MSCGRAVLVMALGLAWCAPARACNVPVFRYALERWAPDLYEMVIFHNGPPGPDEKKLLAELQSCVDAPDGCPTNITLDVVDVAKKMAKPREKLFQLQKNPTLPWVVVRYPEAADIKRNVHEGPLDGDLLKRLFDSPLRRALVEKLMHGETAVWVLLESGNKQKDDETADRLGGYLAKLEKTLKLPELTEAPKDKLRTDMALKIEFSILRLSRQDPEEMQLVRMLLGMEDDLEGRPEPIVFPVFGRGMALWAIVGKGITESNIQRAATFLVGPCSCEIKAQNPGVDLLLTANWEERLTRTVTKAPELPPLTNLIPEMPVTKDGPEPSTSGAILTGGGIETRPERTQQVLWREIILALGGALLVVILGSMLIFARKK